MKIVVPENVGGELAKLEGPCVAIIEKVILGISHNSQQPKATFRYVISEMEGNDEAAGQNVLETFSLQPQAMFNLNDVWKEVTGERLPMGEFSKEEFENMLNETLAGTEWDLILAIEIPQGAEEERTVIKQRALR